MAKQNGATPEVETEESTFEVRVEVHGNDQDVIEYPMKSDPKNGIKGIATSLKNSLKSIQTFTLTSKGFPGDIQIVVNALGKRNPDDIIVLSEGSSEVALPVSTLRNLANEVKNLDVRARKARGIGGGRKADEGITEL